MRTPLDCACIAHTYEKHEASPAFEMNAREGLERLVFFLGRQDAEFSKIGRSGVDRAPFVFRADLEDPTEYSKRRASAEGAACHT